MRHHLSDVLGRHGLPGLGPQAVQVGGEDVVGAEQPLDRHGRGDVGDHEQLVQVVDGEAQHPEHAVGAVDEGQALLLLQLDGPDAGRGQGVGRRHPLAVGVADHALAHQGECAVRQRGEVAGAAERAVLVHHGRDAGVEHRDVGRQGLLADAGAPGREGGDAQQHEGAHDLALDLRAGARGVRADEGALQLVALLDRDVPGGQRAEARSRRRSGARCRSASPRITSRVRRTSTRDSSATRTGAPSRATRTTSSTVSGPVPTVTGSRPGRASAAGVTAADGSASVYAAGRPGVVASVMSSIGAPGRGPCTGAAPPYRLSSETHPAGRPTGEPRTRP